jgi:hypothetical protein
MFFLVELQMRNRWQQLNMKIEGNRKGKFVFDKESIKEKRRLVRR